MAEAVASTDSDLNTSAAPFLVSALLLARLRLKNSPLVLPRGELCSSFSLPCPAPRALAQRPTLNKEMVWFHAPEKQRVTRCMSKLCLAGVRDGSAAAVAGIGPAVLRELCI